MCTLQSAKKVKNSWNKFKCQKKLIIELNKKYYMQQSREGPIERICHETLRKFMRPPKGKFGIALFWTLEHCELKITTYLLQSCKKFLNQNFCVLVPNIIIIIIIYLCYIFQPTNIIIFFFRARFFNSGCTDAFTAFAFLAFLLALLDLILELQSGNV